MSKSQLVSLVAAFAAALSFLASYHFTGTDAGTVTLWVGIAAGLVGGVNEGLHSSTGVTWVGLLTLAVSILTKYEGQLPTWVPIVLGIVGAVLTASGGQVANTAVSASST